MTTVRDVMSNEVTSVTTAEVVGPVRDLLLNRRIGMVPVMDAAGALAGVVTVSDLAEEWAPQLGVVEIMNRDVLTVSPDATFDEAADMMVTKEVHHLVVTDGDAVVGVLSTFDLVRHLVDRVQAADKASSGAVRAAVGDHIVIRGHATGQKQRQGLITEARGAGGGPPYMVQWLDDPHDEAHEVLFFPGSDADIQHDPPG